MYPSLTARSRALWQGLASAPAEFAPALRIVVSPGSRLCPPHWVGLVVIAHEVLATASAADVASTVQQALEALPADSLTDAWILRSQLQVVEMLGPACLAYLDPGEFRPQRAPVAVRQLQLHDGDLQEFIAGSGAEDVDESGIDEITSPAFAAWERGTITSVAGYRDWPGGVAHLSVMTAAAARGQGLARVVASAAVAHAIQLGKLPQWRARTEASRRIARSLGFQELGSQVSVRIQYGTHRTDDR
jgi:GNAT superfamily N-acetyltransferase